MYNDDPVRVGEWIGVFFLSMIPIINIIMLLVWAFGNTKPSKSNYAKAVLIMMVIGLVLSVVFGLFV